MNTKRSGSEITAEAAKILNNENASNIQKSLAAGVLSQRDPSKQTGAKMEGKAAKVMHSCKYSEETKRLAASLLSQANKER